MTLSPGFGVDGPTALATQAPHLHGCMPASLGRRAAARGLDVVLCAILGVVAALPILLVSSPTQGRALGLVVQVLVLLLALAVFAYFGRTGYLPGGKLLGIRQVRLGDGSSPGWSGFLKYLLISVVTGVSLGIGYLVTVALIRRPLNRAWHDRTTGLIVLDVRAGRDPATPAHVVTAHAIPPAPAISLVGLEAVSAPPTHGDWMHPETTQATVLGTVSPPSSGDTFGPPASTPGPVSVVGSELGVITAVPGRPARTTDQMAAPEPAVAPEAPVDVRSQVGISAEESEDRTLLAPNTFSISPATRVWALLADDGERISVDRVVVVGRNPTAPPDFPEARLVELRDPSMSTSKTHAVLRPDPEGVWVMDLHSTNGSAVTTPSGIRTAVPAGGALVVATGGQLHLGRRSFRVLGGDHDQ